MSKAKSIPSSRGDASMQMTVNDVELPNGVRLQHVEQGDPAGNPLLLVHAVGDSWRSFEGILAHLPESINAFAPTLRGHGNASRPDSGYRSSDFAADLRAFMDGLGLESAVIAGGSSGGLVAQRFSIDYPDRVLGLVLLGSPLTLGNKPGVQALWDSTFASLTDPIDPGWVRGFVEMTAGARVPAAFVEAMVQESLKVPAAVWKATVAGILKDDFSAELDRIGAPTLVVWGDADTLLPRTDQEALARGIRRARLLVYPGAGHVFYWEDPARAARDIASFVEEIAVRI